MGGEAVQEESEEHQEPDGLRSLRNLEWWGGSGADGLGCLYTSTDALLLNQAATLQDAPGSLKVAIGEAREAAAQAVLDAISDVDVLGAWRCFLAFDRMIFGELFEKGEVQQHTVAERVASRLQDFWAGRWEALLRDTTVSVKAAAGPISKGVTVRRVRRLLLEGEISKAAASAWGPAKWAPAEDTLRAFAQQQHPAEDAPQYGLEGGPDLAAAALLRDDVQAYVANKWTKTPRGSGAGVQGDRYEHWRPLAHTESQGAATAQVLARLVGGDVPPEALDLALAGRLQGRAKKDGGTRVLACGAIARRMVARAVCTLRADSIKTAVSELQYGIGVPAGLEMLHKSISAEAEQSPDMAFVSLDLKSAFTRIRRRALLRRVRQRCPELESLVAQWYGRVTVHAAAGAGGASRKAEQQEGLDQGCPLSPALFSIGIGSELCAFRDYLRALDPRCKVWAYLDDAYFTVPKALLHQALAMATTLFSQLGLELNVAKTKVWCPDGRAASLPDGAGAWVVDALPCLGSTVSFVRARPDEDDDEWRDTHAEILDQTSPAAAAPRLAAFGDALEGLEAAGLEKQHCFTLLRTYVNGAVTHLQRARLAPRGRWRSFDDEVVAQLERLVGPGLTANGREVLFLPAKEGGAGFGSAERRADAAWLGSWHAVQAAVRAGQAAPSLARAEEATPKLTAAVSEAKARLRADGAWVPWDPRCVVKQKTYTRQVVDRRRRWLLDRLSEPEAGLLHSHGGTGSTALEPPTRAQHLLGNDEFAVTLRRRLLYEDPAGTGGRPCCNTASGTTVPCGASTHEPLAEHASKCPVGPGFVRRHDATRDTLGEWLAERYGQNAVSFEQRIPTWDRRTGEGIQHAVLDVVLAFPGGRACCDVSVAEVLAPAGPDRRRRAATAGIAAREREREKHTRYPGPGLCAAVLESGGRMGAELQGFLRAHAPGADRAAALADVRQRLVVAVARGTAAMLLSAAGPRPRPWRSPAQAAGRGR